MNWKRGLRYGLLLCLLLGGAMAAPPLLASGERSVLIECPRCGAIDVTEYDATRLRCNNCGYVFKKEAQ